MFKKHFHDRFEYGWLEYSGNNTIINTSYCYQIFVVLFLFLYRSYSELYCKHYLRIKVSLKISVFILLWKYFTPVSWVKSDVVSCHNFHRTVFIKLIYIDNPRDFYLDIDKLFIFDENMDNDYVMNIRTYVWWIFICMLMKFEYC